MSLLSGIERSGIVTTDLDRACALGSDAVIFARETYWSGLESGLEIGANGSHEHDYHIVFRGAHADLGRDTDLERTNIERSTRLVGRDETLVEFYYFSNHLLEEFDGHGLHRDALGASDETLGIFIHAEDSDFAVGASESLKAFERLLAIVETAGCDMQGNIFRIADYDFSPLAVGESTSYIVIGFHVAER